MDCARSADHRWIAPPLVGSGLIPEGPVDWRLTVAFASELKERYAAAVRFSDLQHLSGRSLRRCVATDTHCAAASLQTLTALLRGG